MNIAICDDEDEVIETVIKVCRNTLSVPPHISAFHSAEGLMKNLGTGSNVIDLFILDIEMPGKNGFWLKRELEQYHYKSNIIYLTSHDEMIQEAFGRDVIGFVDKVAFNKDKNILAEKLREFEQTEQRRKVVCLKDEKGDFCIQYDRIVKIISEHVYSYVEFSTGEIKNGIIMTDRKLVRRTLKEWENLLDNEFLRVSKQCIINMNYIQRFDRKTILKDGSEIIIPRSNVNYCREYFFEFCRIKMKWS